MLQESAASANWLSLKVEKSERDTVEFRAFYSEKRKFFQLHETSRFIIENNQWRYLDGDLHDDCGRIELGRNDPCFCGSGKKHKQCCLTKLK